MRNLMIAATLAIATIAGAGTAMAGEGIPALPAQPLVSATAPSVAGQAYPTFGSRHRPVVSDQFTAVTGGQNYPTFAAPHQTSRLASSQIGRVNGPVATASIATSSPTHG